MRSVNARSAATAGLLSLGAAYVHLAYTESHWQEWWAYGAFFLGCAIAQGAFAIVVSARPRHGVIAAGIAGNLAIVGMYLVSRTAGPPLGPHAHAIESAGVIDLLTTAAEVGLVLVLLGMLDRPARAWIVNALVCGGAVLWTLRLTGHLA